ncbi:MAG: dihydrofolate reductase family protein [Pseudooceanicola sp.]
MRDIIYDAAVSADGFICAPGGDISAFPAEGDHVAAYFERLGGYGTALMGRRTYEFGYEYGLAPGADPYPGMDTVVVSRTLDLPAGSAVRRITLDEVDALKSGKDAPVYLCGGGMLAGALLRAGLIDAVVLKCAPILLGAGVPLFDGAALPVSARLTEARDHASGVRTLRFRL